ncbi:hypothetical protein D8B26_005152 [Coccidioides posadasii str. Silveira]|uniref:Uncharacterized protein n=3 Tax=Coccidioides posadasii TaxID=199306 RepID=E9D611_COCPS|nr:TRAF-type zinc finger containing protein [Coccidioides posadasii C735 delta SOWgp]EER24519.1 TRAF-type zinc finger containing protein [Coccidioides posadasii C735 delta SOWgp]EFW18355.1 conserved hypothetical protein [Coccidioides posadasii str. Silveira]KMM66264.1 hypothetical protein CPAG_02604 [Coccidioides posadasii RMSCC 3488]QVM10493.1 hypothetical protein D8B26_005152 [Coccidioides posadasii str. Silveira]|eukprot:XP_003066664.1 TRAF-type zinc finger containing protein [Coccidioides posadasii C735 delta SOWgp]
MASDTDSLVDLQSLETVSEYDGHLMCPICHSPFVRPMQLSCDHIFCETCLDTCARALDSSDSIVSSQSLPDDFICPTCRLPTTSPPKSAPRLIVAMCDEILVKCPWSDHGCDEIMQRGYVRSHLEKHCNYRLVSCPDEDCDKMIRKRDIILDGYCLHEPGTCTDCGEEVIQLMIAEHKYKTCPKAEVRCSGCEAVFFRCDLEEHKNRCLKTACKASIYGCRARLPKSEMGTHERACPLANLGPYLESQSTRIASMETMIRLLQQRNEVLEEGIASIRSALQANSRPLAAGAATSSSDTSIENQPTSASEPMIDTTTRAQSSTANNTNTTTYLLSIHESLRGEVTQLADALSALDARANMTILNENLRLREDMAHISAGLNTVRMQVHMLVNSTLQQGQQRMMGNRPSPTPGSSGVSGLNTPGPSTSASQGRGIVELPERSRRLSDSREGTKL